MSLKGLVCLVTGVTGMVGSAIVRELLSSKEPPAEIRGLDVAWPDAAHDEFGGRVVRFEGSVEDLDLVQRACAGADVVFHCAALVDWRVWAPEEPVRRINLVGTHHVLRAALAAKARALIYTSSIDVVYDPNVGLFGADETLPMPRTFHSPYAKTKGEGEKAALAQNNANGVLRTCSLRPVGIFGEKDRYHIGNMLQSARNGELVARIGDGSALFHHVYVGNLAHAELCAAQKLLARDEKVCGSVYFIGDEAPMPFFDFMEPFVVHAGYAMPPRSRYIPFWLMYGLALCVEGTAAVARALLPAAWSAWLMERFPAKLTRQAVCGVGMHQTVNDSKARAELGYNPIYTPEEARRRTMEWFDAHPVP